MKTDGNELFEAMLEKVAAFRSNVESQAENFLHYPFRKVFHEFHAKLEALETIRDPKRFFEKLSTDKDILKPPATSANNWMIFLAGLCRNTRK